MRLKSLHADVRSEVGGRPHVKFSTAQHERFFGLSPKTRLQLGFTDLCEMKHAADLFTIDHDYAASLQNKLTAYQELSKDRRTLHLVMVTTNGVARNSYYNMIQHEVTIDQLFM